MRRHHAALKAAGLTAEREGFSYTDTKKFVDRGVQTELTARSSAPYREAELQQSDARAWLVQLREVLAMETAKQLADAEVALRLLIDAVLHEARWLGDEAEARKKFLAVPAVLSALDANASARRILKEAQGTADRARSDALYARLKGREGTKLHGRTLTMRYVENMTFLTVVLPLEIHVEKSLDRREVERFLAEPDQTLGAALDASLLSARKALVKRVADQLRELVRRIRTLPHIELLSDDDIANTVGPYYGALNKSLKNRRARSALVAVEEKAREAKYQGDVVKLNAHRDAFADVASYYPLARSLKRQLVLFVGPTNSGKTWRALNELAEANEGAYLAPLRLLALEGQEEMEKRGKICSYLTGEERDLRPGATFVSSTIEMLSLENQVEAVVVDEVQLLADERRGWAWLAAVVGAPAKKVIMTGSPDCVPLVKSLAAYLGEELTIHECQRYNELRVAKKPIKLKDVKPGTAVVCFSRRDVLRLKGQIQEQTNLSVAVVYGNLSPQVRREEARRFRSGEAEILVATDAIAMGLNLPIREVVFYTTEKFNGEEVAELSFSDIRQIGGRAGRYGVADFGVVNALDEDGLELIAEAIADSPEPLEPPFYVAPGHNHVRIISQVLGTDSLERILTFFEKAIEFSDERFARSNIDDLSYLSTFVDERLPFLEVTERLTIASAPVGIRNETVVHWFLNRMLPVFPDPSNPDEQLDDLDDLFKASSYFEHEGATSQLELRDAEDYLKTLTVYAWMAYRYPTVFTRIDECEARREIANAFVERSLRGTLKKKAERGEGEGGEKRGGRGGKRRRGGRSRR